MKTQFEKMSADLDRLMDDAAAGRKWAQNRLKAVDLLLDRKRLTKFAAECRVKGVKPSDEITLPPELAFEFDRCCALALREYDEDNAVASLQKQRIAAEKKGRKFSTERL